MTHILVIWTIVAGAGTQFSTHYENDWRPIGEFTSAKACEAAGLQLGKPSSKYRCLPKAVQP